MSATKQVTLYADDQTRMLLNAAAKVEGRSAKAVLGDAVAAYVERHHAGARVRRAAELLAELDDLVSGGGV